MGTSTSSIKRTTITNTVYLSECIQSYGENCQHSCSGQCINRTCDRFNGHCFCDGKYGKTWSTIGKNQVLKIFLPIINWLSLKHFCTDSLQNGGTDVASSTFWIVAFFISLLINTVLTSTILINRRYEMKYFFLQFRKENNCCLYSDFDFKQ